MTCDVTLIDYDDNSKTLYVADVLEGLIKYVDNEGCECSIKVFSDGIGVKRRSKDYSLTLILKDEAYALIDTIEGKLRIDVEMVAYNASSDGIIVTYLIGGAKHTICIRY